MIRSKRCGLVFMALACAFVLSACGTRNNSAGDGIAELKSWMKDLKLEKKQFEEGKIPGDADGGEMYAFEQNKRGFPHLYRWREESQATSIAAVAGIYPPLT